MKAILALSLLVCSTAAHANSVELLETCNATNEIFQSDVTVNVVSGYGGLTAVKTLRANGQEQTTSSEAQRVEYTIREGALNVDPYSPESSSLNYGERVINILHSLQNDPEANGAFSSGIADLTSVRALKGFTISKIKIGAVTMDNIVATAYDKEGQALGKFIYADAFPAACR